MSNEINKSYKFYKDLYQPPGGIFPPQDKKLTFVHKLIVAVILKPRKFKEIPNTISHFEWDHVRSKLKFRLMIATIILCPIPFYFFYARPMLDYQDRWMEKAEMKKYGEVRKDEHIKRW